MLLTGSAGEVLARIVPGDPLRIRPLAAARLRDRALFFDAHRVALGAFACIATGAVRWRGRPELAEWLTARVDEALDRLLAEERGRTGSTEPAIAGVAPGPPDLLGSLGSLGAFAQLARPLRLNPGALASACAAFHALDRRVRVAFFELLVDGRGDATRAASPSQPPGVPAAPLAPGARDLAHHALDVLRRFASPPHRQATQP